MYRARKNLIFFFLSVSENLNYAPNGTFAHICAVSPSYPMTADCPNRREMPPERAFLGALAGFEPEGAIMRRQGSICA